MKIALAQVKLRTGDLENNFKKIVENVEAAVKQKAELVVFSELTFCSSGVKDLCRDKVFLQSQENFIKQLAEKKYPITIILGDATFCFEKCYNRYVSIYKGNVTALDGGKFEFKKKQIVISDSLVFSGHCDIFVWTKNNYFTMDSHNKNFENARKFVKVNKCNFIHVNSVSMADETIFAGQSFALNNDAKLLWQAPLCKEELKVLDFDHVIEEKKPCFEEDVYNVLTFALKEYCDIFGFKKVLLGLSGGIDSAITAALAVNALGSENVSGILMPSMFSSQGSIDDSLKLAENLGISTREVPITPFFNDFIKDVAKERLHDIAEENLQARLRGLILMFFSNREHHLVLSTGNKSEIAMGYATLYGDMVGGYNLIGDLTKERVYALSNWVNRNGEVIPQEIIDKAPSAELRPGQKDEDSLPKYKILDDIIEMHIEKNLPIEDIYKKHPKELVDDTIKRIYHAQYKRKQACMGVRLTERAFCSNVAIPIVQKFY